MSCNLSFGKLNDLASLENSVYPYSLTTFNREYMINDSISVSCELRKRENTILNANLNFVDFYSMNMLNLNYVSFD